MNIRVGIGAFFTWWGRELMAFIPRRVARFFRGRGGRLVVDLFDDGAVLTFMNGDEETRLGTLDMTCSTQQQKNDFASLTRNIFRGTVVTSLRLVPENVLRKIILLPEAAAANLNEVIGFEMDRQTPFRSEDVYFDNRVIGHNSDTRQLEVELTVARRDIVDQAMESVAVWGLLPDRVDVISDDVENSRLLNLLPLGGQSTSRSFFGFLTPAMTVLVMALTIVALVLPLTQRQQQLNALQIRLDAARGNANAASALEKEIDRILTASRLLTEKRSGAIRMTHTLHEITSLLPDNSWVGSLRINGQEIRITGFSATASSLIGILQSSPMLEQVRFRSPVTQDARLGVERFSISARLVTENGS